MEYKNKFTEIHVFTRNGEYIGIYSLMKISEFQ